MDEWRKNYPSVVVTRTYRGDRALAMPFYGDGNKLLYQLKNLMTFRNLDQLKMTRIFTDGTVIKAWSIFGQNFIDIDVTNKVEKEKICTITFIDFPLAVPPMQNPDVIEAEDVVGVDYFKTYYSFDVSRCITCQDIVWDFLFTYSEPVESRHYDDEPNNHTVYSLSPPAWGEIISHGSDEGGNYIIWKAYTETGEYSRTGLAIMLLKGAISDNKGAIICNQQQKIDVDCCLKDSTLRPVEIWWEDFGTCSPYINYGDVSICEMPNSVAIWGLAGLIAYTTPFYAAKPLYGIPEIKGSCLPLEWTLTGPISFVNSDKNDNLIYFMIDSGIGCTEEVEITLKDRCETQYVVVGRSCCEDAAAISINYTSLLMSCNQQQDFQAIGGCSPYAWSLTGGGGSLNPTTGGTVTYSSPATNPNCTSNPTIMVTDCCGNTAQIQLAVNCYTGGEYALALIDFTACFGVGGSCSCTRGIGGICEQCFRGAWDFVVTRYDCSGILVYTCETNPACAWGGGAPCGGTPGVMSCTDYPWYQYYPPSIGSCWTNQCGGACGGGSGDPCDVQTDCRSAAMKAAGCCPINPWTGLPY